MTVFGPPIDELALDDVRTYLAAAADEPLLWEAKDTTLRPASIRKEVCGFANGFEPGYLILGASQVDGRWTVDGVRFPDPEPGTWISNVLGEDLRPRPHFVPKVFPTGPDRHVAVVEVHPVAAAPCITNGTVFERLPGKTQPVRDSNRLLELVQRGRDAQSAAALAVQSERTSSFIVEVEIFYLRAKVVGPAGDLSRQVFSPSFERLIDQTMGDVLQAPRQGDVTHRQDRLWASGRGLSPRRVEFEWHLTIRTDGLTVLRHQVVAPIAVPDSLEAVATGPIRDGWSAAEVLGRHLLGGGPIHVALDFGSRLRLGSWWQAALERGPLTTPVDPEVFDGMARELQRATGTQAYEPDRP